MKQEQLFSEWQSLTQMVLRRKCSEALAGACQRFITTGRATVSTNGVLIEVEKTDTVLLVAEVRSCFLRRRYLRLWPSPAKPLQIVKKHCIVHIIVESVAGTGHSK